MTCKIIFFFQLQFYVYWFPIFVSDLLLLKSFYLRSILFNVVSADLPNPQFLHPTLGLSKLSLTCLFSTTMLLWCHHLLSASKKRPTWCESLIVWRALKFSPRNRMCLQENECGRNLFSSDCLALTLRRVPEFTSPRLPADVHGGELRGVQGVSPPYLL